MMDSARRQELRELCSGTSDQGRLWVLECLDEIENLRNAIRQQVDVPVVVEQAAKLAKQELALANLKQENEHLRDGLGDAINFMKDAKRVSIKSRGFQLEAEFRLDD